MRRTLLALTAIVASGSIVAAGSASTGGNADALRASHVANGQGALFRLGGNVVRAKPRISIANAARPEGNSGASALVFAVKLSAASRKVVSVHYATSDGSASSASDYTAASGTLKFRPGQKRKAIAVKVAGDQDIEQNESFTLTLSSPRNARLGKATATGTIVNDDNAPPVMAITTGSYKGSTQNGNYVFFTVNSNRTVTGFRVNDLPDQCQPGGEITGGEDFGDSSFTIGDDGSFAADGNWDGSSVSGDVEFTHWDGKITGQFSSANAASGTIVMNYALNYQGTHYTCSSGTVNWTASLQG
jgi:Calx-beta domain-containing protein